MINLLETYSSLLWAGFCNTWLVSLLALFFSTIIGSLIGMMQTSTYLGIRKIGNIYVEFFRNIPFSYLHVLLCGNSPFILLKLMALQLDFWG